MRFVAFLRGINVSGQKIIKMDALKAMFVAAGFQHVVTYIQSGNVLFDVNESDTVLLRHKVEALIKNGVGFEVPTIIRSIDEIKNAIERNPCPLVVTEEGRKLYVHFLSETPAAGKIALLHPALLPGEELHHVDRELYFVTPGAGNTKLTNALMEKKLGVVSTARNWATVNKVVGL